MNIPKMSPCKDCGKKPKEIIWAFGYSDKDDELYLVHWCNFQNKKVHFPELKKHPFTAHYVNGQRPLVREAWNNLNQKVVANDR
jgi:hypothetical protein